MFGIFGLGPQEILILLALGFVLVAAPAGVVLAIVLATRKRRPPDED